MFILVEGGSKAGKSRWAERAVEQLGDGPRLYVATMVPVGEGEAGTATVQRHRAQRAGMGFVTHEQPLHLAEVPVPPGAIVLLEDVSNLLANYLFTPGENGGLAQAKRDVLALAGKAGHLLAVSFHGFTQSDDYDVGTNRYIAELDMLNELLCQAADAVVQLEQGRPTLKKGTLPFALEPGD